MLIFGDLQVCSSLPIIDPDGVGSYIGAVPRVAVRALC